MVSSLLPKSPLAALTLLITLCLLIHGGLCKKEVPLSITYHGGPLLTGNVNLAVLWYGQFELSEKTAIQTFIKSLSMDRSLSFNPDVSVWWQKVESYLAAAMPKIITDKKSALLRKKSSVRIAKEVNDENASVGKVLTRESLPDLLKKATAGLANTVAVIFAAKDITVLDTCSSACYLHGVEGKQVYIVLGNPEERCPGVCAMPFHRSDVRDGRPAAALILEPASGNVGADAMVIQFASALVETVTNPFNTGFFGAKAGKYQEAARACAGSFASGAFPGYPGSVRVDPVTGGAFNIHGFNDTKFLLPALWDLKTTSCWTPL